MAHEIVPNINRLAQAVRDTGGTVIWIQTAYTDETLTSWSTLYGMMLPEGRASARKFSLSPSNKGYEIFADLKIEPHGPDRREEPLQRLHPGLVEYRGGAAQPRPRHAC